MYCPTVGYLNQKPNKRPIGEVPFAATGLASTADEAFGASGSNSGVGHGVCGGKRTFGRGGGGDPSEGNAVAVEGRSRSGTGRAGSKCTVAGRSRGREESEAEADDVETGDNEDPGDEAAADDSSGISLKAGSK